MMHSRDIPALRVLAVIVNYRSAPMTLRAVEATLEALAPVSGALVVVDNASHDGSARALRDALDQMPGGADVTLVESPLNGGFGAGVNLGIAAGLPDGSHPDFIWCVNSDALPDPDALTPLLSAMVADPKLGFAGSYIEGTDGVPHNTAFRFPTLASELEGAAQLGLLSRLLRHHIVALPVPEESCAVDWTAGVSLLMRMEMLETVGTFDEGFFLYYEETELMHRAAQAGWTTRFVRESRVRHIGSVSTGRKGWARVPGYLLDSRWRYFAQRHSRAYALASTLTYAAGSLPGELWRALRGRPHPIAPHYLRDLLAHDLRAARPEAERTPS